MTPPTDPTDDPTAGAAETPAASAAPATADIDDTFGTGARDTGAADPTGSPTDEAADPTDAEGEAGGGHDFAAESVEHLRVAAHELIAAARAALDAAEDFVDDPQTKSSLTDVAEIVTSFIRSVVPTRRPASATTDDDDPDDPSTIERIEII